MSDTKTWNQMSDEERAAVRRRTGEQVEAFLRERNACAAEAFNPLPASPQPEPFAATFPRVAEEHGGDAQW